MLDANLAAHRYYLPLSAASVVLLLASSALALRDLGRACAVPGGTGQGLNLRVTRAARS